MRSMKKSQPLDSPCMRGIFDIGDDIKMVKNDLTETTSKELITVTIQTKAAVDKITERLDEMERPPVDDDSPQAVARRKEWCDFINKTHAAQLDKEQENLRLAAEKKEYMKPENVRARFKVEQERLKAIEEFHQDRVANDAGDRAFAERQKRRAAMTEEQCEQEYRDFAALPNVGPQRMPGVNPSNERLSSEILKTTRAELQGEAMQALLSSDPTSSATGTVSGAIKMRDLVEGVDFRYQH